MAFSKLLKWLDATKEATANKVALRGASAECSFGALTATSGAYSGNVAVGGTLGVTGEATFGTIVSITSLTADSAGITDLSGTTLDYLDGTFVTLEATGNTAVGGDLTVSGTITGTLTNAAVAAAIAEDPEAARDAANIPFRVFDGGDPTGVASSSQAIQDFLDGLPDGFNVVVFPAGSTYLCNRLSIPAQTHIIAHGASFVVGGTNPTGQSVADGFQLGIWNARGTYETHISDVRISGGHYYGTFLNYTEIQQDDIIQAQYCDNLIIEDCIIEHCGQDAIEIKTCDNVVIRNNRIGPEIYDAGIEVRGGTNVHVHHNVVIDARDGFMTKPQDAVDGVTPEIVGSGYLVENNDFTVYRTGILNEWVNDSTFQNNIIRPKTDGAGIVGISTDEHPTVPREDSTMKNIVVRGNRLIGNISNTWIRQIPPSGCTFEMCYYEDNIAEGRVAKGFDITGGIVTVRNNKITTLPANTDYGLFIAPDGDSLVDGNVFYGKVEIDGDPANVVSVVLQNNKCNQFIANDSKVTFTGNLCYSISLLTNCHESVVSGNTFDDSATVTAFMIIYGDRQRITNNTVATTKSMGGISVYGSGCFISGNDITNGGSTGILCSGTAPSTKCTVIGNRVTLGVASGGCIYANGSNHRIIGNTTTGGAQGIRIYGNECDVIGNYAENSQYQQIHIMSSATDTHVDHNTIGGTGTGYQDEGTSTVAGSNRF